EMLTQTVPERRAALTVREATHLGDDPGRKVTCEFGHMNEPGAGQQTAVEAVPVRLTEKQRAERGGAGEVVGQEQRRLLAVDIQFTAGGARQPAPVAVPRLPQAGGGHHATGAYHLPLLVFQ